MLKSGWFVADRGGLSGWGKRDRYKRGETDHDIELGISGVTPVP